MKYDSPRRVLHHDQSINRGSAMTTTVYFDNVLQDTENKATAIALEFGRSSSIHGNDLMYFLLDGTQVTIDAKMGRELYEKMRDLALYLGYEK